MSTTERTGETVQSHEESYQRPHLRYLDEFIRLKSAPLLLELRIYPDSKEITEAMAAFEAVRRHLRISAAPTATPKKRYVLCIGDGSTPRSAAIFAIMWKGWEALAIDPMLKPYVDDDNREKDRFTVRRAQGGQTPKMLDFTSSWAQKIDRLKVYRAKIQDVTIKCDEAVIVLVHAHVTLADVMAAVDCPKIRGVVTLPCCQYLVNHKSLWDRPPDVTYRDDSIGSLQNEVRIWRGENEVTLCQEVAEVAITGKAAKSRERKTAPDWYKTPTQEQIRLLEKAYEATSKYYKDDMEKVAAAVDLSVDQCRQWFKKHRKMRNKKMRTLGLMESKCKSVPAPTTIRDNEIDAWRHYAIARTAKPWDSTVSVDDTIAFVNETTKAMQPGEVYQLTNDTITLSGNNTTVETMQCKTITDATGIVQRPEIYGNASRTILCQGEVLFTRKCSSSLFLSVGEHATNASSELQIVFISDHAVLEKKLDSSIGSPAEVQMPSDFRQLFKCWKRSIKVGDWIQFTGVPGRTLSSTKSKASDARPVLYCWNLWLVGNVAPMGRMKI